MSEIEQAFFALETLVGSYDPISLLSQLTATFLFVPEDEFQGEDGDVVEWQQRMEFLVAFILVRPYPSQAAQVVDGTAIGLIEEVLKKYFHVVTRQLVFEATRTSEKDLLLAEAKIHSLHVRGDAYPHQFYAFAQELYGPHDDWFRQHYGFTIAEGINLAQALGQYYEERFNRSLEQSRDDARAKAAELIASNEATEDQRSDLERKIFCALHFGEAEGLLGFTSGEISQYSGVPIETCQLFLNRMSQEFGHRNPRFPASFTEPTTAAWDYNTLNERPIVRRGNKHWLFVPPLLRSSLLNTFYFDIIRDDDYGPTFNAARGTYLEATTAKCLNRIFPPGMTLLNPFYPNGEEMADVMVLHDHKILLFQCKFKPLTHRARTGADFDALRTDLRGAIADSFQQGIRARDYLRANRQAQFVFQGKTFVIDMDQINEIYLVGITSMPFQNLAARFANTNGALGLFSENEYPWSLSLGCLDVLTQVLSTPGHFIHYAQRRRQVEATPFRVQADEMDYLGFYLSHGMRFDLEDFAGMNDVALSGFSNDVDRWVHETFELNHQVEPPSSPMPNGFSDFLRDAERTQNDDRTDCAIALLDLGSPARKRFMEMVTQTKARTIEDKGLHSVSLLLKEGKRGLSFLSFDAHLDRNRLFEQVASFAMIKKYEAKCDEWVGFGWDIASDKVVDVAFFVSQKWSYDEEVERLVKEKLRPGHRIEL